MLTFRSGAAGFCDLAGDSGTGNFGGFRSSCTSNLIVADGVLNAPDYTRTCVCAYQLQTSLALIHMPEMESWTFGNTDYFSTQQKQIGINFGAPGDHRDHEEILWFESPVIGGPSPRIQIETSPAQPKTYQEHSSLLDKHELSWVSASGFVDIENVKFKLPLSTKSKTVTVRLVFSEPEHVEVGERLFDVSLNGQKVLSDLDIRARTKVSKGTLVLNYSNIPYSGELEIQLSPKPGSLPPVLSGAAIIVD